MRRAHGGSGAARRTRATAGDSQLSDEKRRWLGEEQRQWLDRRGWPAKRRRAGGRSTLPLPSNPVGDGGSMTRKKGGGFVETATNTARSGPLNGVASENDFKGL
uniref:Uncharacterized protein n=1 Tax=Oryza barthii TaxID=65489 RepID=A0A0D3GGC9_9ORYZ